MPTDVVQAVIAALNSAFNAAGAGGGAGPFSGLPANPIPTSDAQGMMSAFLDTLLSRKAGKALSISSDYTITDSDGVVELLVTTGTGTINITLPASATNQARDIKITKADTGAGGINIVPAGSDTIMRGASTLAFGSPTYPQAQDASISFSCRGSNWAEHNGPIIGKNSNGTYIKWGNGLLVCYNVMQQALSTSVIWAYPSAYLAAPYISATPINITGVNNDRYAWVFGSPVRTATSVTIAARGGDVASNNTFISMISIGMYK